MTISTQIILALESLLALASVVLAFLSPALGRRALAPARRAFSRLAARPGRAIWMVALLPCLARFALLPWMPVPQPAIQEEFSYLLQADTFAHGRLTNPTSPVAVFFDNVEVIQSPHYESVRPPAQGAFLALGEALLHLPWLGVVLSVTLMNAAVYWMLLGWTRPRWALLAALLFGLRFGIFTFWMNSYWGSAPAVLGGALALGAAPRILRDPRLQDVFWLMLGCGLLATTRPYEGVFFVLPIFVALLLGWVRSRDRARFRRWTLRAVLPAAGLGVAWLALLGCVNRATTGHTGKFVYQVWNDQQSIVPTFWWQPLRTPEPVYYSPQTREFKAVWEVEVYRRLHARPAQTAWLLAFRFLRFFSFHLRPLFLLPLLFWPNPRDSRILTRSSLAPWLGFAVGLVALVFRGARYPGQHVLTVFATLLLFFLLLAWCWLRLMSNRAFRLPGAILFCGAVSALPTTYWMENYDAHYAVVLFLLVAEGMRRISAWRRGTGEGAAIVRNLIVSSVGIAVLLAALAVLRIPVTGEDPFHWSSYENRLQDRANVAAWLARQPGRQLAIVRYGPRHDVLREWVYNLADLENAQTVWARELQPDWTAALIDHYKDRRIWLIEPDARPVRVQPYPIGELPAPATALPTPGQSSSAGK